MIWGKKSKEKFVAFYVTNVGRSFSVTKKEKPEVRIDDEISEKIALIQLSSHLRL